MTQLALNIAAITAGQQPVDEETTTQRQFQGSYGPLKPRAKTKKVSVRRQAWPQEGSPRQDISEEWKAVAATMLRPGHCPAIKRHSKGTKKSVTQQARQQGESSRY